MARTRRPTTVKRHWQGTTQKLRHAFCVLLSLSLYVTSRHLFNYCTSLRKSRPIHATPSLHRHSEPGIERVQALADIFRSALRYHRNETRAPIANPPNSAQLEGTTYHSSSYIRVRVVVWECGEGQTQTYPQTSMTSIYFASATPHAKRNQP